MQLVPPEVKDTPEAPKQAREALRQMGPMSRDQVIMSATMAGAVVLWVLGDQLQIPAVVAAMLGLCSLLITGVLKWKDCLEYSQVIPSTCALAERHVVLHSYSLLCVSGNITEVYNAGLPAAAIAASHDILQQYVNPASCTGNSARIMFSKPTEL